jgi:hypothetical protein
MPKARLLLIAAACSALAHAAAAQDKLAWMLPTLYGPNGLFVNSEALLPTGQTHSAHFNSSFQSSFAPFNTALATQLAAVPIPAPASGFTYTYDAALGVFNRTTESYGPILTERAETLGKGRASLGFSHQRFSFDSIEGVSLDALPVVFTHDNPAAGTGRDDVVTTTNSIGVQMSQFITSFNYGASDRLDVAVAIPVVVLDMNVTSQATVQRIGTVNPAVHFFYVPTGDTFGEQATYRRQGHASGVGDVLVRLKFEAAKKGSFAMALGVEGRAPTGDEENLLGSGAWGAKPFLVMSSSHKRASPHLKLAYQWNGDSLLAGNVLAGTKSKLSDQVLLETGIDIGFGKKVTLAADLLARRVIDGERMAADTFHALDGRSQFPNVRFFRESYNLVHGAAGLKVNPGGNLLVVLNLLFKVNDNGLKDRVTPLFGVEYSF